MNYEHCGCVDEKGQNYGMEINSSDGVLSELHKITRLS